jgi:excisionase family DNA binding protein
MRKKANTMLDDILTMQELADYLKLNAKTAYRLVAQGEIPGFKVGGSWRFRSGDIVDWVKEQMKQRKHG